MAAKLIDGKAFSQSLRGKIATAVACLKHEHNVTPGLAVVLVGEDPASQIYVKNKARQTVEAGMLSFEHKLPATTSEAELLSLIEELNADAAVHGILVQLPLPAHIAEKAVIESIAPCKDVDGFHPENVGQVASGEGGVVPCTPLGSLMLIKDALGDLSGKTAVVIGRSNIVGKPMAQLLLANNCTVTIAHSRTRDIASVARAADIIVAAVGRPEMIKGDWIKPGACVIDVGINRVDKLDGTGHRVVGDVAFSEASEVAGNITPVPGGVGPMTIACLLANTYLAACRSVGATAVDIF
ncbi:bifunctional methylenetetrahydrofolate dehydrogenase/methenyltetrahydrofolate cyclohydrolase FolD [Paraburkholderia sp. CNPSo 3272]|uniref:bifunctional methylenetetrahydrofolate dehydrogenase/methenyltetrahydrofolate cyclohydrolase FolD n=1 Tax=Paraburkholderia sp. CNPSo 3272 TaxID=2940931 RepID=UPI0020B8271B|nr:bifunctional methylenetetrahydrofolate dehydrogenase/methenyltetrahydrofolate cyclohydrolase FolD [Paraburkholderia sp. CNPSo 3272]MCP3727098.1 bifunctional methylenetetrahydrofolate dehydrogenase/methenyltetrahydrofolate cyclohydrolase FolD [Paraburkholderia sp. CNPSo 3272]